MIEFKMTSVQAGDKFPATLLEIGIDGGVCEPSDLSKITVPNIPADRGVVISGRAPVWLFGFLTHHFHVCQWVATFDPRLAGGVVVSRHHADAPQVGEVVSIPKNGDGDDPQPDKVSRYTSLPDCFR